MGGTGSFPIYANYTHNNTFSETLRLEFDQSTTSYSQLLDAYWRYVPPGSSCYDPAYCPRIFFVDGEQEKAARASLAAHNSTVEELQILPASEFVFWKAEEVHQQYNKKMGFPCGTALTGCSQRKRWHLQVHAVCGTHDDMAWQRYSRCCVPHMTAWCTNRTGASIGARAQVREPNSVHTHSQTESAWPGGVVRGEVYMNGAHSCRPIE